MTMRRFVKIALILWGVPTDIKRHFLSVKNMSLVVIQPMDQHILAE